MNKISKRMEGLSGRRRELLELLLEEQHLEPSSSERIVPSDRADDLPLSFAQERLWFLSRFDPGSSAYNIADAVRLLGRLNVQALAKSFSEVVRRHESLRTTFSEINGQAVQVIHQAEPVEMPVIDLSELTEARRESEATKLAAEEARVAFDLAKGPLLSIKLFRLGEEEHIVLLILHHIISDGWSRTVLMRELATSYSAYTRGEETGLEELAIQYADYAVWQRSYLQGAVLDEHIAYWKERLGDSPPMLELPTDRTHPTIQSDSAGSYTAVLSEETTEALKAISWQEGATLFMTVLAVFKVLLSKYSGQHDVSVGTPIANRNRVETEGLIGFFTNTLVLRTDLSGDPSFRELVRRVKEVALGAYAHQDLPFEKLVEELQPERSLSHSPLVQVWFNLLNFADKEEQIEMAGITAIPFIFSLARSKFDLSLYAREQNENLRVDIFFRHDLFVPDTMVMMFRHFEELLQKVAASPERRLSELKLSNKIKGLDSSIISSHVRSTNAFIEFEKREIEQSITDRFERQVEEHPDNIAVKTENFEWTYEALNRAANRVARAILAERGGGEERIALLLDHDAPMISGILGVLKTGKTYVPLDPYYPSQRLAYMVEDSRASAILTNTANLGLARELAKGDVCAINIQDLKPTSADNVGHRMAPDSIAYILYTSGSTGQPKGVMQNHRNVLHFIRNYTNGLHICADDRLSLLSSYCFDGAIMDIFGALLNGAGLYPINVRDKGLLDLSERLINQGITIYHSTPTVYRYFIDTLKGTEEFPRLRLIVLGGEEARRRDAESYRKFFSDECILVNGLGPTESTVTLQYFINKQTEIDRNSLPVGYPVEDTEILLLNSEGQEAPTFGEIAIRSPYVALGYWQKPEMTREAFLPDPEDDNKRVYRTRDMGRLLPNGAIEYAGRKDFQVKIRGFRIELTEIEGALMQHPAIKEAVVIARDDKAGSKQLVAYLVSNLQPGPSTSSLRDYLKQRLPDYMLPSAYVALSHLPLTSNGKLDRAALPMPQQHRLEQGQDHQAPRTPTEEVVAGIWERVLGVEQVGIEEDFFDLGGHSLLATQVMSRVRDELKADVGVRAIFEEATVRGLAERIDRQLRGGEVIRWAGIERAVREGPIPLSFAQERLWFLDQWEPGSGFYNIAAAVRLRGELSVRALERALGEVIRRHESLRTSFYSIDGQPLQVISAPKSIKLSVIDISHLSEQGRETEARKLAAEEAQLPFDLSQGPLVRFTLLRLDRQDHAALMTLHHIVSDGWSTGIFIREVAALYEAYLKGEESPLEELPIQYADYAVWQRGWLQGEVLERGLAYWRKQLEGLAPMLELPTDRPRPAVQSFEGASQPLTIDEGVTKELKALSRREGATLFMTLIAAFKVLLHRYTGQAAISVGTPVGGRDHVQVEPLIGFFVNTLVLKTEITGEATFREMIGREREVCFGAYAHSDVPFEKLVGELQPERSSSHTPLFQVMFTLQNMPQTVLKLAGLTLSSLGAESSTAKFDLSLVLFETGQQLAGSLNYNTHLFDDVTIARMLEHFQVLLHGIVTNPEERVIDLPLLTKSESRRLLVEWNDTERGYSQQKCIHELFERQVECTPNAVAVIYEDEWLTYRQLNERANQVAHYLAEKGIGRGSRVPVLMDRCAELVISLIAIMKTGAAFAPLDINWPTERLNKVLDDLSSEIILVGKGTPSWAELLDLHLVPVDLTVSEPTSNLNARVDSGDPIYIIFTSGSTGLPKGVIVPHRGIINRFLWMNDFFGQEVSHAVLQTTRHVYDSAVWQLMWPLINGGKTIIPSTEMELDVDYITGVIEKHAIRMVDFVPSVFNTLIVNLMADGAQRDRLRTLRSVIVGGEEITPATTYLFREQFPEVRIVNLYGPTEASIGCIYHEVIGDEGARIPIGRPISNAQVLILDQGRKLVPIGVRGEIYLSGVCLGLGYLKDEEKTRAAFVDNEFQEIRSDRLYKTGDRGRWLNDGEIEYLGRVDHQIKIRGLRIELGEIETVLGLHPSVREAVVMAREDKAGHKQLVAYMVTSHEPAPTASKLRDYLKQKLPDYMLPSAYVVMSQLPLTASGKVDRAALPMPQQARADSGYGYEAPRTPTEEVVAGIWEQVLGAEQVGVEDDFFELGGHSLLATQVMSRVRQAFRVEVGLRVIFEEPTVRGLAERIDKQVRQGEVVEIGEIGRAGRCEALPLSFAQERLWFLDQLVPDNPFYNLPTGVRLRGNLNVTALERTLGEIIRRHESLRTSFHAVDGQPLQVITPAQRLVIPVADISELAEEGREVEAQLLAAQEAQCPFDLSQSPLRIKLIRLSEQDHVVLVTMHHIASDGWSTGIFIREVATLYEAYLKEEESPLEELPIQYADYAVWQRKWLESRVFQAQLSYWKRQLEGSPPLLNLPTDRPRSGIQSFRGKSQSLVLPMELVGELRAIARAESATLFMVLLAAFKVLLYRYSGQQDICVGTPIANRNRVETEGLIGFFVNTLVMRTDLSGGPSFGELLRRVKERALGAYAHQDLPFEKLVEALQPERNLSHTPLFQVMFALQNAPRQALQLPELTLTPLNQESGVMRFDLEFHLWERPSNFVVQLRYSTDLFDPPTIARLMGHLQTLLEGAASGPDQQISCLPLLTEAERHQLLVEWNNTRTDYLDNSCVHNLFEAQAKQTPSAVAVEFGPEHLTYEELNYRADQLAHYLRALGTGLEARVGLCVERSLEMIIGVMGILKAGAAYVPLDPAHPKQRLAFILEDAGISILLTRQRFLNMLPDHPAKVVCLDTIREYMATQDTGPPISTVSPENSAYVIYTSGSTGKPKGVQIAHKSVVSLLNDLRSKPWLTPDEVWAAITTLSFDIAAVELFLPLSMGARIMLLSREEAMDGAALSERLVKSPITILQGTPTTYQLLMEAGWHRREKLKVFCAGEALARDLANELLQKNCSLWNLYGPTEATIYSTIHKVDIGDNTVPIGRPVANTQTYLLDSNLHPVPIGIPGELYIGGMGLAQGYLNRPELTAERFIPNPFGGERGERLYKTGDLARYLPDGPIEFLGRIDHQVKVRGFRIELGEIESVLRQHPFVQEAVVVARDYGPGNRRLESYIVPNRDSVEAMEAASHPQQVSQWQSVWAKIYQQPLSNPDSKLDFVGWNSSYTGLPIPSHEMREWVSNTVERILALRPERVLEIGCGTGLLLSRIAPHCAQYYGTDYSQEVLLYLRQQLDGSQPRLPQVTLSHRTADGFEGIESDSFDVVILNSVVQYFPSAQYLLRVIEGAISVMKPSGFIFLGDIRSLPLAEAFYASLEMHQGSSSLPLAQLRRRIKNRADRESELVIDPAFFVRLKQHLPKISHVQIHLKRGPYHNELTRFRYDVILRVGASVHPAIDVPELEWQEQEVTLSNVRTLLLESEPPILRLKGVPNARVSEEIQAVELLTTEQEIETVHDLREKLYRSGTDPEEFWSLGDELGYRVEVTWSGSGADGSYDVVFRSDAELATQTFTDLLPVPGDHFDQKHWSCYTNNPSREVSEQRSIAELRRFLQGKLPDYMVPSAFVILDAIPLSPNGKLDRGMLPAPEQDRSDLEASFIAPRDALELELAKIWEEILGIQPIGVRDNFFDLGGHSLLAVRLMARIERELDDRLPLAALFRGATVEHLAKLLRGRASSEPSSLLVTIQSEGSSKPFFCVHPAGGNVVCYARMARSLGTERPFYGLQAQGLDGRSDPLTRIEDMAARYVEEMRAVQASGPYLLGGWSVGGVVAFEMAQRLQAEGQEVSLLALIDSTAPVFKYEPMGDDDTRLLARFAQDVGLRLSDLLSWEQVGGLEPDEQVRYIWRMAKDAGLIPPDVEVEEVSRLLNIYKLNVRAMRAYEPRPYAGRVVLLRSEQAGSYSQGDANGWGRVISEGLEVHDVPGDHYTMLREPKVEVLAEKLRASIRLTGV